MATGRVTRNRTGPEPLGTGTGTGTVCDRFRTAPNRETVKPPEKSRRNRETAGKNRREPGQKTRGLEPEPVRENRSNGSMEPVLEPEPGPVRLNRLNGSMEPEAGPVRLNRLNGSMEPEPPILAVREPLHFPL